MSINIQASSGGELRRVEFDARLNRIFIFIGDNCIGLDDEDAIALRDQLADALTQASIHNDAKSAGEVAA